MTDPAPNTADARDADYLDLFAAYHALKREHSYALSALDAALDAVEERAGQYDDLLASVYAVLQNAPGKDEAAAAHAALAFGARFSGVDPERIAAALELHDDLTTLQDPRHSVTIEIEGPGVDGTLAFMGATPVEIIHTAAEWVRAQQEGQLS